MIFDGVARHKSGVLSLERFRQLIQSQRERDGGKKQCQKLSEEGSPYQFPGVLPTLKEVEERLIQEALHRSKGNQGIAAGFLGISRQALNQRLKKRK